MMRQFTKILLFCVVSIFGLSSAAFGETITKAFEIGEGTANNSSHRRDFSIPCGLDVAAKVKYSRKGTAAVENDVPITIELVSPGNLGESSKVEKTLNVVAKTTVQTATLNGAKAQNGCSDYWSVRVKTTNGSSPLAVSGDISLSYTQPFPYLAWETEQNNLNLDSGNSAERGIQSVVNQGVLEIKGTWNHNLGVMPIKMRFQLLSPDGAVVATAEGYSDKEVNPCCSGQKLKLTYQVRTFVPGKWKVRMTNISMGHDAVRVNPFAGFRYSCP